MRKPGVSLKTLLIDLRDGKKGREYRCRDGVWRGPGPEKKKERRLDIAGGHGGHYWGDDINDLYTLKDAWQVSEIKRNPQVFFLKKSCSCFLHKKIAERGAKR